MQRRWLVILVGGAVAAWAVVVVLLLVGGARELRAGRDAAVRAAQGLDESTLLDTATAERFDAAADHFRSARRAVRHPLVSPLRIAPMLGRQLRAVDASSAAAATISEVAGQGLREARRLADAPVTDGLARLRLLAGLRELVGDAQRRVDGLDLGPDEALSRPIAQARADLAQRVSEARHALDDAAQVLRALSTALTGPTRYLLLAANNSEMRAGSGMWLVGGVLTMDQGRLELGTMQPIYQLAPPPRDAVPIEDEALRAHWGWMEPNNEWRSLMASPRFPASAALGVQMWSAAGHEPVDGLFVVDALGLSDLVAATGPVTVDDRTFDRDTIIRELLHDQYERFRGDPNTERREALGDVAEAVFGALDAGRWEVRTLIERLVDSVRGRHLLAWSPDPAQQAGWQAGGLHGRLRASSLAVSLLNRGGNKLDWFVPMRSTLTTRPGAAGTEVSLRIQAENQVPLGEPTYVAGPYPRIGTVEGEYLGVVAVSVPAAAQRLEIVGAPAMTSGVDGPTRMIAAEVRMKRGEEIDLEVRFTLPAPHRHLMVEPSARFPAIRWSHGAASWVDRQQHRVVW